MHHRPRRGHKVCFADVVALFFSLHHAVNELDQLFVGSPTAHEFVQVVIPNRKQASADFAVGGNADAAAVSAEGMRNRSYDSDFADAIIKVITPRSFATRTRNFDQ